jgi:hypothetical protein
MKMLNHRMIKKPPRPGYVHHQMIPLMEGVAAILDSMHEPEKATRHPVGDYTVHTTSLRLRTFAVKGTRCYICGAEATQFSIDSQSHNNQNNKNWSPHMNLWGVRKDGSALLFTHDHIIDRAKGGKDSLENAEPCCIDCNGAKNNYENAHIAIPPKGMDKGARVEKINGVFVRTDL